MAISDLFAKKIESFSVKALDNSEKTVRSTAGMLFGDIIKSTPVYEGPDHVGGVARANWFASGGRESSEITSVADTSNGGTATSRKVASVVAGAPDWSVFTLTNNMPYIGKLEYGSSKQAPQGMVRVNVTRFEKLIAQEAAKNV